MAKTKALISYREADLRLYFRIGKNRFSRDDEHIFVLYTSFRPKLLELDVGFCETLIVFYQTALTKSNVPDIKIILYTLYIQNQIQLRNKLA